MSAVDVFTDLEYILLLLLCNPGAGAGWLEKREFPKINFRHVDPGVYVFGKEMKSLLYKNTLIFFLGGSKKELRAHLYFFGDTPSGPIAQS